MEITTDLVKHLSNLSRLKFDEKETENFKEEFAKTMTQIDKIEKAVRAAKQIFSDDPKDNQSKKEYCINYVKTLTDKMDIELTSEEISLLIEGI